MMSMYFGEAHIKTLMTLQKIAEKHNATLHFGFDDVIDENEIDEDFLKGFDVDEKALNDLLYSAHVFVGYKHFRAVRVWFELFEKDNNKRHVMTYASYKQEFEIEDYDSPNVSTEFEDFLENIDNSYASVDGCRYIIEDTPTLIRGFGNAEPVKDYRCYRSGMAVKCFGDLICDYFKESRISEVY